MLYLVHFASSGPALVNRRRRDAPQLITGERLN
jgi:hypothetical protein